MLNRGQCFRAARGRRARSGSARPPALTPARSPTRPLPCRLPGLLAHPPARRPDRSSASPRARSTPPARPLPRLPPGPLAPAGLPAPSPAPGSACPLARPGAVPLNPAPAPLPRRPPGRVLPKLGRVLSKLVRVLPARAVGPGPGTTTDRQCVGPPHGLSRRRAGALVSRDRYAHSTGVF